MSIAEYDSGRFVAERDAGIPVCPRESMRVLPKALQPFLTWMVGKPLPEQTSWQLTPWHHLFAALIPLAVGVALAGVGVTLKQWWLLLLVPGWMLSVHGSRKLRATILHQCAHGNFVRNKRIDSALGRAISIVSFSQEYFDYKQEHVPGHHSSKHMSMEDPTVQYLILRMRARAGMRREQLWRRLFLTLLSPYFHVMTMYRRFASHFRGTPIWYRVVFASTLILQVAVVTALNAWTLFLVAWVIPLGVLFNVAVALRVASEHIFPPAGMDPDKLDKVARAARFTNGIFLGEAAPSPHPSRIIRAGRWARWGFRMLFVHLPWRLMVMEGDGPCHDYHHRYPRSVDWPNYIFARQRDLTSPGGQENPYTEVWGLFAAIDAVFVSLSKADPAMYDPALLETPQEEGRPVTMAATLPI